MPQPPSDKRVGYAVKHESNAIARERLDVQRERIASQERIAGMKSPQPRERKSKLSTSGSMLLILIAIILFMQVVFGDLGNKLFNWINYARGVPGPGGPNTQPAQATFDRASTNNSLSQMGTPSTNLITPLNIPTSTT